jgi:hypothetical protein
MDPQTQGDQRAGRDSQYIGEWREHSRMPESAVALQEGRLGAQGEATWGCIEHKTGELTKDRHISTIGHH